MTQDPTEPVPPSQGQAAYQRLIGDIRSGALAPGARLREVELARRLGLSRTPVREALRLLESEGLVAHLPRQGATVRQLDYAEVAELYEMRSVLEGTAARLAARIASEVELEELEVLQAGVEAALGGGDDRASSEANRRFHAALHDAARNRFLTGAIRGLERTMLILGPTTLGDPERQQGAAAEHRAILAALQARDGAAAEAAMQAHIRNAHRARLRGPRPGLPG
ncbi:GntR family transcriptional regulator [Mangrovicoccus algicola]|uniref:GntR family transcriptional regulator n=1 Tax=Mangrovicoccus algicola TaxID=2771008 RepID=A0A8J6Z5L3_9RHOB|nr:GntR family transcriptional regulator [Mangrovicoccus algicola]MBE3636740.1 GntR family transcriptional regulator [Mangrovicoccus algicola]